MEHPGQPEVGRVARLAARAQRAGDPRRGPPDDLARAGGPLLERVLLDDEPDLLVAALDLLLGSDQSCHVEIASSIFGYVPQRQRLPAIACRISSERRLRVRLDERRGGHDLAGRAEAALEGVRAYERVDERMVAQPLDRRHVAPADGVDERDARKTGTPSSSTVQAPQCPSPQAIFVPVSPMSSRSVSASVCPTGSSS